jgi:hypothetical protein
MCMSLSPYKKQIKILSIFSLVIIIVIGVWGSVYAGNQIREKDLNSLLLRVKNIALFVDTSKIKALDGADSDLTKAEYQNLKIKLTQVRAVNDDTRFIYLMGLKNNQQFFYADSEDPSSKDYSPPGQVYAEATDTDIYNHKNGIAYINGPYHDDWGNWISAYAPVIDPDTNTTIAMVGMDVNASEFNSHIVFVETMVIIVSLLIFLCVVLFVVLNNRIDTYVSELEKTNQDLQLSKEYLTEAEQIARLGQFTWNASTNDISMSKIIMDILGVSSNKMSLDKFMSYVDSADIDRIKNIFLKIDPITTYMNFKYKINGPENKKHYMVSLCKIKRDSKENISRVVCTAQDVTDTF